MPIRRTGTFEELSEYDSVGGSTYQILGGPTTVTQETESVIIYKDGTVYKARAGTDGTII